MYRRARGGDLLRGAVGSEDGQDALGVVVVRPLRQRWRAQWFLLLVVAFFQGNVVGLVLVVVFE
jgi:hypothetical protein